MPNFVNVIFLGSRTFTRNSVVPELWTDSDNGHGYYFHYVANQMQFCRERIYVK